MRRLLPTDQSSDDVVEDTELERIYAYPDAPSQPWVRVNFVHSADGAVSVHGRSAGLSDHNDKRVFQLGRAFADVILVGAGTARAEKYRGVRDTEVPVDRRRAAGLAAVPQIAVVTRTGAIDPDSALINAAEVPTIVLTTQAAPVQRRMALAAAGAEVVLAGETDVDAEAALAALDERGLRRVCCEGGPHLFGTLIAADAVDELCLSVAPLLVGGDAGRIATGIPPVRPRRMTLASALVADDLLLLRYLRRHPLS